jgi:hypothetical protein
VAGWAHHTLDIYDVEVFAVSTRKGWRKLRKTVPFISRKPGAAGLTSWSVVQTRKADGKGTPRGHLVLWVDAQRHHGPGALVDTCAHEAHHGAERILGWAGVEDSEASAHLTGWLTGWLFESVTEEAK